MVDWCTGWAAVAVEPVLRSVCAGERVGEQRTRPRSPRYFVILIRLVSPPTFVLGCPYGSSTWNSCSHCAAVKQLIRVSLLLDLPRRPPLARVTPSLVGAHSPSATCSSAPRRACPVPRPNAPQLLHKTLPSLPCTTLPCLVAVPCCPPSTSQPTLPPQRRPPRSRAFYHCVTAIAFARNVCCCCVLQVCRSSQSVPPSAPSPRSSAQYPVGRPPRNSIPQRSSRPFAPLARAISLRFRDRVRTQRLLLLCTPGVPLEPKRTTQCSESSFFRTVSGGQAAAKHHPSAILASFRASRPCHLVASRIFSSIALPLCVL